MTNSERVNLIENAIRQYKNSESKESILDAINMMENVYILCSNWKTKGIDRLQKIIKEAEYKVSTVQ